MSKERPKRNKQETSKTNLISNFINQDPDEPKKKKLRKEIAENKDDETMDESLKFFKKVETKIKSVNPQPSTSSSEVVSSFLNKFSNDKKPLVPAKNKRKASSAKPTKKKAKAQPDIRKVLSKNDRLFHHILSESCHEDGVDPEEMQMALAISESLKTQSEASTSSKTEDVEKFENPFQSGKIQSISTVLERYGFKSKKVYTEYELEMIMNNKKRSKYQKVPTVLTRTTDQQRNELIQSRIYDILDSNLSQEEINSGCDNYCYQVYSYYLQEMQETLNTVFHINRAEEKTSEIILKYYVTDLFEPSYTRADHLLRDWSSIPGRDLSPGRKFTAENTENTLTEAWDGPVEEKQEKSNSQPEGDSKNNKEKTIESLSRASSCSDIFAGLDSFEETGEELALKLSTLQEKFSQTQTEEKLSEDVQMDSVAEKRDSMLDIIEKEFEEMDSNVFNATKNSSEFSSDTIEYCPSLTELNKCTENSNNQAKIENSVEEINLLSSDEESIQKPEKSASEKACIESHNSQDVEVYDLTQVDLEEEKNECLSQTEEFCDLTQMDREEDKIINSQNSTNECEVVEISDEEINYSTRNFNKNSSSSSSATQNSQLQDMKSDEIIEIDNNYEHSYFDTMAGNDQNYNIENSVAGLLEKTDVPTTPLSATKQNRSMQVINEKGFSDSILEILKKYGEPSEKSIKSFNKIQSESNLETSSANLDISTTEDVRLSVDNDSFKENSLTFNRTIHQSLESIMSTPVAKKSRKSLEKRARKSLGVQVDDDYLIDTDTYIPEPNYKSMTPVELKQELFKFGIRPLPVKKAIELLEFIYDQMHPKVRIAADEEVDVNDSRRIMNLTDIVTNIGIQEDDDFVFQPEIVENEEYILPKSKKSKIPSCSVPLHIAFYNMVRSNPTLQKYILEYRPLDLDNIYKHFRKFGLSFQLNDIIAFLDRRCITFKTKEQSYSKTYQQKKQKRSQKS